MGRAGAAPGPTVGHGVGRDQGAILDGPDMAGTGPEVERALSDGTGDAAGTALDRDHALAPDAPPVRRWTPVRATDAGGAGDPERKSLALGAKCADRNLRASDRRRPAASCRSVSLPATR